MLTRRVSWRCARVLTVSFSAVAGGLLRPDDFSVSRLITPPPPSPWATWSAPTGSGVRAPAPRQVAPQVTDVSLASRKPRASSASRLGLASRVSRTWARPVFVVGHRCPLGMAGSGGPYRQWTSPPTCRTLRLTSLRAPCGPSQPGATAHLPSTSAMWWREDGVTTAPPPSRRTQRLRSSVRLTPCYRAEAFPRHRHPGASWAAACPVGCAHVKIPFGTAPPCASWPAPVIPPFASAVGAWTSRPGFGEGLMQRAMVWEAERSFGVLVSMLVAPSGAFESHTYLSAYLAWRMNSLRDLGPPFLGGSVVVFRSFVGCRAPMIWEVHANRALARGGAPTLSPATGCCHYQLAVVASPALATIYTFRRVCSMPWRSAASRGRFRSGSPHVPVGTRVPSWSSETWRRTEICLVLIACLLTQGHKRDSGLGSA